MIYLNTNARHEKLLKRTSPSKPILKPNNMVTELYTGQKLSSTHYKWFEYAGQIALESDLLFKLGCVATYAGKMIACGCNNHNNYSKYDNMCDYSCSCHAEINVIRKCLKLIGEEKMKRVNLYVARMDSKQNFQNSAPCYDCTLEIKRLKIKNIIFKDDICVRIMNPVHYNNEHRTFGYYYLKKNIPENSIRYKRRYYRRRSKCKCHRPSHYPYDNQYIEG